jgi:hypothetical protein
LADRGSNKLAHSGWIVKGIEVDIADENCGNRRIETGGLEAASGLFMYVCAQAPTVSEKMPSSSEHNKYATRWG